MDFYYISARNKTKKTTTHRNVGERKCRIGKLFDSLEQTILMIAIFVG